MSEWSPIAKRIYMLRKSLITCRYQYYVLHENTIADAVYDKREAELKELVTTYPNTAKKLPYHKECPTTTLGSDDPYDYPREIELFARQMLDEHIRYNT